MDPAKIIALRLCREGYGDYRALLRSPSRDVIDMLVHANFLADFNETAGEINRPEGSK